ncbi:hypothetical protein IAD21_00005 [Abditibacteriota bacterium]|nr:hypothetical protein IAD21_00005 [Abditibacteriota bacterium]
MNWRKWFGVRRREDGELKRLRKEVEALPQPRSQHYSFAHRLLPAIAMQMGAMSVLVLANSEKSELFLQDVWRDCGQDAEGDDLVSPEGLQASVTRAEDKLIAIVTLPRPERITEAHFVAILSDLPPETDDEDSEVSEEAHEVLRLMLRSMPVRYFTLEKGASLDRTPRTVFCEWTSEHRHLNMGDGPAPLEDHFFRFLAAQNFPAVRASFDPNRERPVQEGE